MIDIYNEIQTFIMTAIILGTSIGVMIAFTKRSW